MGDFVTNPSTTLPGPKQAEVSIPPGKDPNKRIRASDYNALRSALLDLRDAVRGSSARPTLEALRVNARADDGTIRAYVVGGNFETPMGDQKVGLGVYATPENGDDASHFHVGCGNGVIGFNEIHVDSYPDHNEVECYTKWGSQFQMWAEELGAFLYLQNKEYQSVQIGSRSDGESWDGIPLPAGAYLRAGDGNQPLSIEVGGITTRAPVSVKSTYPDQANARVVFPIFPDGPAGHTGSDYLTSGLAVYQDGVDVGDCANLKCYGFPEDAGNGLGERWGFAELYASHQDATLNLETHDDNPGTPENMAADRAVRAWIENGHPAGARRAQVGITDGGEAPRAVFQEDENGPRILMRSPNGTLYRITVSNAGALVVAPE